MAMEVLSSTDALFLKTLACGATAYLSYSYLQRCRQKPVEPLIPPRKKILTDKAQQLSLPPNRNVAKALDRAGKQCVVFYGSQTGTAERLACQFSKEAKIRFSLECLVADLDDYDYDDLLALSGDMVAVFFLATYGEGEATDNAVAFNRYLQTLSESAARTGSTLRYAGFGLGNSSYQFYNEIIKRLDSALTRHSTQRVGPIGLGDDGKGSLEEDYMTWKDATLPQLASCFGLFERPYKYEPTFQATMKRPRPTTETFLGEPNKRHLRNKSRGPYTLANPYAAPMVAARELCSNGPRQFLHMEVDLSGSTLSYEVGDHLAVRPVNSDLEVDRFLRVFGLTAARDEEIDISSFDTAIKIPIPTPTTYDALARYYLEISAPVTRQVLATASTFAPTEAAKSRLKILCARTDALQREVIDRRLNIAQVLETCERSTPWNGVPFSALLENIAVMKPRYYSISSSPLVSRSTVSITTVVESQKIAETTEEFKGVATNYLLALSSSLRNDTRSATTTHQIAGPRKRYTDPTVLISIRRSKLKLPRDSSTPIIMIGPGTGVAPFRGFLQSRARRSQEGKTVGRTLLFYGCRRGGEDFLYRDEWEQFTQTMTPEVFSMHVAFSREEDKPKTYVQHLLREHEEELRKLIVDKGAYVYVCGDAKRMARDVWKTMAEVVAGESQFGGDRGSAESYLSGLKSSGRWLEDVW